MIWGLGEGGASGSGGDLSAGGVFPMRVLRRVDGFRSPSVLGRKLGGLDVYVPGENFGIDVQRKGCGHRFV